MRSLIHSLRALLAALPVVFVLLGHDSPALAQACPDTVGVGDTIVVTRHAGDAGSANFTVSNPTSCQDTVFFSWSEARMIFSWDEASPANIAAHGSALATVTVSWSEFGPPCYPGLGTYYHDAIVVVNWQDYKHITIKEVVVNPEPPCNFTLSAQYHGATLLAGSTLQHDEVISLDLLWTCDCLGCQVECSMPNLWEYSTDNGATWHTFHDEQYWDYFDWTVPNVATTKFHIRVTGKDFYGGPFSDQLGPFTIQADPLTCCVGTTGEVDAAGIIDLSDLSLLILYLTSPAGAYGLPCATEANVNGSGIIDLSDLSLLIAYLTVPKTTLPDCL